MKDYFIIFFFILLTSSIKTSCRDADFAVNGQTGSQDMQDLKIFLSGQLLAYCLLSAFATFRIDTNNSNNNNVIAEPLGCLILMCLVPKLFRAL